jgi:DNA-binding beta-propeller fold protein YncE
MVTQKTEKEPQRTTKNSLEIRSLLCGSLRYRLLPSELLSLKESWRRLWIPLLFFFLLPSSFFPFPFLFACSSSHRKSTSDKDPLITLVGSRGTAAGRFSFPRGIDVDRGGRVAVSDKSGRIMLFDSLGKPLAEWKAPKWDNGTPTGLVFDETDPTTETLLIADTHNSRILRYSLGGRLIKMFGQYGPAPGQMIYPTNLALDPQGNIYITEYGVQDRVMVFDHLGNFLRQWGSFGNGPGQFQRPLALVWAPPDRLIVADACNHRLEVFTKDGKIAAIWGSVGGGLGQFNYPHDLALGKAGLIYVAEYGNTRIQVLDAQGRSVAAYGQAGTGPGQFGAPWGIAAAPDGRLWVADTQNHRLQVLRPEVILGKEKK